MSLVQLRILLRVADAGETCGATGSKDGLRAFLQHGGDMSLKANA
jgi:hypothetical protein